MDFSVLKRLQKKIDHQALIQKGMPWSDPDFPASTQSLYNPKETDHLAPSELELYKRLEWRRPAEIFNKEKFFLFEGMIEPDDIIQGALPNCYFLSALSSLAENSKRIKSLFITDQINSAGVYAIRFCINGEFQEVVVDDQIPYDPMTKGPAFSKCHRNELWVILLEKAWAKINGSYEKTRYGQSSTAFVFLTGSPCLYLDHEYILDFWNDMCQYDKQNYIIVASSQKPETKEEELKQQGLISAHAYSVISVHDDLVYKGKKLQLLKLRNPWGHQEWSGDWNDNDPKWNDELKAKVKLVSADDGIFFMSYQDYLTHYRATSVCLYNELYQKSSINIVSQNGPCMFKFEVPPGQSKAQVNISIYQMYEKFAVLTNKQPYEYSMVRIMISKLESDKQKLVMFPLDFIEGNHSEQHQLTTIMKDLSQGTYYILVEVDWKYPNFVKGFVISHSSSVDIQLQEARVLPNFIENSLKSCAFKKSQRTPYEKEFQGAFKCLSLDDSNFHYGYIYYHNESKSVLNETTIFTSLQGYKILLPFTKEKCTVTVQPNSSEIIVMRRMDPVASLSCKFLQTVTYSNQQLIQLAKTQAQKNTVVFASKSYEIYYYVHLADLTNVAIYFENLTKITSFQGRMKLEIENIKIIDQNGRTIANPELDVSLEPGQNKFFKLEAIDVTKAFKFKYGLAQRCVDKVTDKNEIIKLVKTQGQKKQITIQGSQKQIFYYVGAVGDSYYWYFENQETANCEFGCKIDFQLVGLKLDNGFSYWEMLLKNGQGELHQMIRDENAKAQPSYECSMAFMFKALS